MITMAVLVGSNDGMSVPVGHESRIPGVRLPPAVRELTCHFRLVSKAFSSQIANSGLTSWQSDPPSFPGFSTLALHLSIAHGNLTIPVRVVDNRIPQFISLPARCGHPEGERPSRPTVQ